MSLKPLLRFMFASMLAFTVACASTTLEVENTTDGDIKVKVISKSTQMRTKKGKKITPKPPKVHTVTKGTSKSIPVNAPALNTTAKVMVEITGDWVILNESVEVEVGKPNPKKVTANAGVMEVTNNRGRDLANIWVAEVNPNKDGAIKGVGGLITAATGLGYDFGDSRGAAKQGETLRVGPLVASQHYRIKIAKTGTTIGPGVMQGYVVKPGEVTKVELKPEPEKK